MVRSIIDKIKSNRSIAIRLLITFALLISLIVGVTICAKENKTVYARYSEENSLDYKVYLKPNTFYKDKDGNALEYLGKGKSYIASLIKKIDVNFNYKLSLDEKNVDYSYRYRIDADLSIKGSKSTNPLYTQTENLVSNTYVFVNSNASDVLISKDISIDYNHYNDLVNDFVTAYSITDVTSSLKVNLYVDVVGSCERFQEDGSASSSLSIEIPLTTKTVDININTVQVKDDSINNVMACKKTKNHNTITYPLIGLSIVGIIYLIVSIYLNSKRDRTDEEIYVSKVRKITRNYKSYIQTVEGDLDIDQHKIVRLAKFSDLLEIRDTIQSPILMKDDKDYNRTIFVIPSQQYVYMVEISMGEN